eukprot:3113479-Pleurochrysis_carterae.AAC.1
MPNIAAGCVAADKGTAIGVVDEGSADGRGVECNDGRSGGNGDSGSGAGRAGGGIDLSGSVG